MKGINRCILVIMSLVIVGCAFPDHYENPEVEFSKFKTAAVLPFSAPPEVAPDRVSGITQGVADMVGTRLMKRGWRLVERGRVQSIFEENNLQMTQVPFGEDLNAIQQILGVDALVTGSITEWREFIAMKNDGGVGLTLKVYDARTGELAWTGSASSPITFFDDKRQTLHAQKIVRTLCDSIPSK